MKPEIIDLTDVPENGMNCGCLPAGHTMTENCGARVFERHGDAGFEARLAHGDTSMFLRNTSEKVRDFTTQKRTQSVTGGVSDDVTGKFNFNFQVPFSCGTYHPNSPVTNQPTMDSHNHNGITPAHWDGKFGISPAQHWDGKLYRETQRFPEK
jgi:hypothetical protein